MIAKSPRFWIFSIVLRPIFEAYNTHVTTNTVDEFLNSIIRWLDTHCMLASLRPIMRNSLTKLSVKTQLLTKPEQLHQLAGDALLKEDPTELI